MGLWSESILPRLINVGMRGEKFREQRARCVGQVHGRVLELGFGSGLNLPHYPKGVTQLLALEPSNVSRRLARERIEAAPFEIEFVGLDGADIPLDAGSVDFVTCSWTLCVIPDVTTALKEVRRVLKPGGEFCFVEHGASRVKKVRRLQDRLNGIQKLCAGGCNLNREIDRLVESAGFAQVEVEKYQMSGPRFLASMYAGVALK